MKIDVITLVTNFKMYEEMVLGSLDKEFFNFIPIEKAVSATTGLNRGLYQAKGDLFLFCHQDVSFPVDFKERLQVQLDMLEPEIGVIGSFGRDLNLNVAGNIFNPHPHKVSRGCLPCRALTVDEHCFLFYRHSGLFFDKNQPYFHMYGADVCMKATNMGLKNYIINTEVSHLSPRGKDDGTLKPSIDWFYNKWVDNTNIKIFRTMVCEVNFETGNRISYL